MFSQKDSLEKNNKNELGIVFTPYLLGANENDIDQARFQTGLQFRRQVSEKYKLRLSSFVSAGQWNPTNGKNFELVQIYDSNVVFRQWYKNSSVYDLSLVLNEPKKFPDIHTSFQGSGQTLWPEFKTTQLITAMCNKRIPKTPATQTEITLRRIRPL
jgi:hypothetical protein